MKTRHVSLGLMLIFLASCGGNKRVVTKRDKQPKTPDTQVVVDDPEVDNYSEDNLEEVKAELPRRDFRDAVTDYIDEFYEIAMREMRLYGIPASITLSQGILESGVGKGRLSVEANNHFGIKCHTGWTGKKIYHDDDEEQECFRVYKSAAYSYRDHSLFLVERSRYAGLFKLARDDYESWAKGLRKAGYATDRKYPDKLIDLIERYELYLYDAIVLGKDQSDADKITDKTDRHTVVKGDTLYGIAKEYGLKVEELKQINELEANEIHPGQVLFVTPMKRDY